jgi:hypothetical protein
MKNRLWAAESYTPPKRIVYDTNGEGIASSQNLGGHET